MKPLNSVIIHVINGQYIKVHLGVRLSQDTWDNLFELPKQCPGTFLAHPDKGSKQTFFGFEIRCNSCWNYKTILEYIFDTLKVVEEVETIRINDQFGKSDTTINCKPFTV